MNPKTLLIAKETAARLPWKLIIGVGLGVGGIYAVSRLVRDQQARDNDRRVSQNQNSPSEIARLIYSYGAPEPWQWPNWAYADEKALLDLATTINDLNEVRLAYEQTYRGRRLLDDLQTWLSADEYRQFINIAQKTR